MLTLVTLLGHSLEHFHRLTGELLGSVDRWIAIKPESVALTIAGVECHNEILPDHWDAGRLRTQAVNLVSEGWILHLDSDEWMSSFQIPLIKTYLASLGDDVDCVKLPRRNIEPCIDWENWPDSRPMLHRAGTGIVWTKRVEEWPVGVKRMIESPLTSDFTIIHVHVSRSARELAQRCRDDAKLA